jgi:3-oxoacyl-[acyl-carrier protein] reductase
MPKTQDYFAGKTIIITGAASGIGRAAALIFAREKANVVCADIDEDGLAKTAEAINAIGSQALALTIDVTRRAAVEDMVELAIDGFGSVQFLFNSAGAAIRRAKFLEIDDDLFDRTFDLNVKGTLYPMQAVLPHMLANKFGVIVNMGSMAHRRGGPGSSVHYAAAKGRCDHDHGRGARIRDTRDPRHVDFTRPREDTVSGGGQQLGGTGATFP